QLAGSAAHDVYGVQITPFNDSFNPNLTGPKDFDIRVSTTTADDSAFTTVFSGTLPADSNPHEFDFTAPASARYVEFFFKNANGPSMFVSSLRVLGVPSEGSVLRSVSSPASSGLVGQILDLDTTAGAWVTDAGQNSNQSLILMLPGTSPLTIDQVALQPTPTSIDPGASAKDFDILVSANDMADASFTTAFSGTLQNIAVPQQFSFAPVQARFVKLLLKDNFNGANQLALNSFYVVSPQVGGTTARFV